MGEGAGKQTLCMACAYAQKCMKAVFPDGKTKLSLLSSYY